MLEARPVRTRLERRPDSARKALLMWPNEEANRLAQGARRDPKLSPRNLARLNEPAF